jgi:hypothetical protein
VLFEWAWAFLTGKRAARLITGDVEEPSSRALSSPILPSSPKSA